MKKNPTPNLLYFELHIGIIIEKGILHTLDGSSSLVTGTLKKSWLNEGNFKKSRLKISRTKRGELQGKFDQLFIYSLTEQVPNSEKKKTVYDDL